MHHGMAGCRAMSFPSTGRAVCHPARPISALFWGCWARHSKKSRTGQTSHRLTLMWAGMASPGLCRIHPGSRAAPGDSIKLLLNPASVPAAGSDPAMGYLRLYDSKNPSKYICCSTAARGAGSTRVMLEASTRALPHADGRMSGSEPATPWRSCRIYPAAFPP